MKLEDKIKDVRKKEGLSQEKFAEQLGVSRQTVINWEKGTTPTSFLLIQMANEFHIDFSSLIEDEEELRYLTDDEINVQAGIENPIQESPAPVEESIPCPVKEEHIEENPIPLNQPLYTCERTILTGKFVVSIFIANLFFIYTFVYIGLCAILDVKIDTSEIVLALCLCLFFLGLAFLFARSRKAATVVFYKKRCVLKTGLMKRTISETPIHGVRNIQIQQGFWAKVFDYGYVRIDSIPCNIVLGGVKHPYKLKEFFIKTY